MLTVATVAPSNIMRDSSDSNEPPIVDRVRCAGAEARRRPRADLTAAFLCLRRILMPERRDHESLIFNL